MKILKGPENQPTDVLHMHRDTDGDMQRRQRSRSLASLLAVPVNQRVFAVVTDCIDGSSSDLKRKESPISSRKEEADAQPFPSSQDSFVGPAEKCK